MLRNVIMEKTTLKMLKSGKWSLEMDGYRECKWLHCDGTPWVVADEVKQQVTSGLATVLQNFEEGFR